MAYPKTVHLAPLEDIGFRYADTLCDKHGSQPTMATNVNGGVFAYAAMLGINICAKCRAECIRRGWELL